jgi:hypothetical protein
MAPSTCLTSPRQPRPMLILREKSFVHWLGRARPGSCITYHVGHLATDRVHGLGPLAGPACRELAAVADRAYALAQEGRLLLIQKRHGPGDYSYFAVMPRHRSVPRALP